MKLFLPHQSCKTYLNQRGLRTRILRYLFLGLLLTPWFFMPQASGIVQSANGNYLCVDQQEVGQGAPVSDPTNCWNTPYSTLQAALATARSGDEVWVASGTYYPDEGGRTDDNDPAATFQLPLGVALYGGFAGNESSRQQRDWQANPTILSGDIDGDGTLAGNAYHVVTSRGGETSTRLDGFIISGGNARASDRDGNGGGVYLSDLLLYDGTSGVTPDEEGSTPGSPWFSYTTLDAIPPTNNATQIISGSATLLDSAIANDTTTYAGYNNYNVSQNLVNPQFPALERSSGYVLAFTIRIPVEVTTNPNRAGFSVIAQSSDVAAGVPSSIELGFQDGRVFAQDEGFEAAEATKGFNPVGRATFTRYELEVQGDSYQLRANGRTILSGSLRDYTAFEGPIDPYETPNFIFFGDDTTSARARVEIASIQLRRLVAGPRLANLVLYGNQASTYGGGIYSASSNPTLVNIALSGNTASGGGGMATWASDATLTNVTFSNNQATLLAGGMHNVNSNPTIQNTILWGNTAYGGSQMHNQASTPTISYSLLADSACPAGADCQEESTIFSQDPRFVAASGVDEEAGTLDDDLRLQAESPAIESGTNVADLDGSHEDTATIASITRDLAAGRRIVNSSCSADAVVDMGAYEHQPAYGILAFSAHTRQGAEGNSGAAVDTTIATVERLAGADCAISVQVVAAGGSASPGSDYTNTLPISLTFAAGETSQAVTLPIVGDNTYEADETMHLHLVAQPGMGTTLGAQDTLTYTIQNDDPSPEVTLRMAGSPLMEQGSVATVTATLVPASALTATMTLDFSGTAAGDGTDYRASATNISIPAGSTQGSITLTGVDDNETEGNETIIVEIAEVQHAQVSGTQQVTVVIADDETAGDGHAVYLPLVRR